MTVSAPPRRPLLDAAVPDLAEHDRRTGPLPWRNAPGRLIGDLQDAGLTGRGGAGFPTWRKVASVLTANRPLVIANGAEGEPLSGKDDLLLRHGPHLVLDGLQLLAEAIGATETCCYVKAGPAQDAVTAALAQRRGRDRVRVRVITTPDGFLSGEETAVIAAVSGRRALPTDKRALAVHAGVHGRATLVQNVETVAHVGQIARHGARWFRAAGTKDEPGTMLVTVDGVVREVPIGTPVSALLDPPAVRAVLVGGYHGAWLPVSHLDVPLSRAGLAPLGAAPGAGVLAGVPLGQCPLVAAAGIVRYLAGSSARQCGPCRNGLPATATLLGALAQRTAPPDAARRLDRLAALVTGRGACHHPDGTARLVRSTLAVFDAEVAAHLAGHCTVIGSRA